MTRGVFAVADVCLADRAGLRWLLLGLRGFVSRSKTPQPEVDMLIDASFLRNRAFRLKRRDAIVLFLALENAVEREDVLSYDGIADALNKAGITTQRGAGFTARVVRSLVGEIVDAQLASLEVVDGGFRLRIQDDPYKGASLFDFVCTGTETVSETGSDADLSSSININTQEIQEINTNKRARKKRYSVSNLSKESVGDALGRVDIDDAEGQEIRRSLVSIVWEASLRSELIDRAVAAVKLGYARLSEMIGYARRAALIAKEGRKTIWQSFALDVKRAFDSAGFVWNPTRAGAEPAPAPCWGVGSFKKRFESEPDVFRGRDGLTYVRFAGGAV